MNSAATGRALLLAALNVAAAAQGYTFTDTDLSFGSVSASTNPNREVEVTYTGSGERFTDSAVAFYDRLDLTPLFTGAGIEVVELTKGATTVAELVDALNTRYGCGFTADDFDLAPTIAPEDTEVLLTALAGSYGFKGDLLVSLVEATVPLAEAVVNPELGGLQFTPVDSEAQPA